MSDGKLYIVITDKPGGEGSTGLEGTQAEAQTQQTKKTLLQSYAAHHFYNFVESQAKRFAYFGINNIGNFTGDYLTQKKVNEALQIATIAGNVVSATIAGASVAGIPGAIIGGGLAIAGTAVGASMEGYSQLIENKKTNYNIEQLRKRAGLNNYLDGSRGTEN